MYYTTTICRSLRGQGGKDSSLVVSFFHLTHLLQVGVGLGDALDEVAGLDRGYQHALWSQVAHYVKQGHPLSRAMAFSSTVFDARLIALVHAGEKSGELAVACDACMRQLQWQTSIRSRMTTVLVYPVFALMLLLAVVLFLLVSVVPAMDGFLATDPADASWHARMLLTLSEWLVQNAFVLPALVTVIMLLWYASLQLSSSFRCWSDSMLLRLPLVGMLIRNLELSRFCRTWAHLYGAGVSLTDSMQIAEGVLNSQALIPGLQQCRVRIASGEPLSSSLNSVSVLPSLFKRIVSAGESAGTLEKALLQASEQQQRLTDDAMDRIEKLTGPVLLLLMGGVLLWIVTSLLGPVYQSAVDAVLVP